MTHRRLGLIALVPLAGWIASSFVLHGVGLAAPNGLQGVYELSPHHMGEVRLDAADVLPPARILASLRAEGLDRIYWLRLEPLAGRAAYVVKPGPYALERVYDARTGERLDPLPEAELTRIADDELMGTSVASVREEDEFNRYYDMKRVPALAMEMVGDQPTELVISRASGRTLRRTDPLAGAFEKAYRSVHVWQWGDAVKVFTGVLFGLVAVTLALVILGYVLWFDRRAARARWTNQVRRARRVHARFALAAGFILATQMLVGAYLWFNLGLIEPRFRGQGSFEAAWSGGISVQEDLAPASTVRALLPDTSTSSSTPMQRFEWRGIGSRRFFVAYPARDRDGILIDARSGAVLDRLSPDLAREAGEMVVQGSAVGPPEESEEYWMDFNARVPTYLFRFSDPDDTDVHVSQTTGEVVQRRPGIWRVFGPFLAYHTFGFTGNAWLDTLLLSVLQALVLVMMVSGWRMSRLRRRVGPDAVD